MLQGIAGGFLIALIIIAFLEIYRFFRKINKSFKDISEIKEKVNGIEDFLRNQNK